jgi:ABC-type Fe3+/spermidine/putrescine transport system ATPase subunit
VTDDTPVLELRDISKSFGSVQALTDVDLEVHRGEVMALVGDNGAGKSTLIKCIAGIHAADSGEIIFDGKRVTISGPKDAARLGIEIVYQDLALCDNLALADHGRPSSNAASTTVAAAPNRGTIAMGIPPVAAEPDLPHLPNWRAIANLPRVPHFVVVPRRARLEEICYFLVLGR